MGLSVLIGFVAGLHTACYGAYKDSPYESFYSSRFVRDLILGVITSVLLFIVFDSSKIPTSIFFLVILAISRIVVEGYKQFIRVEPQDHYKIPSMVHVFRTVISSRVARLGLGIGFFGLFYLALLLSQYIRRNASGQVSGVLIGLVIETLNALGGAYKDGFFEGFQLRKFFRSPIVGIVCGYVLSFLTLDPFLLMCSIGGLERMIVEFYKGFVKAKYVPGKFKFTKAVYPEYFEKRKKILPVYAATWVFFIGLLFMNFRS